VSHVGRYPWESPICVEFISCRGFFSFFRFPKKYFPVKPKNRKRSLARNERKTEWQKKSKIEIPKTANIRLLIIRYLVTAEHEKKSET
jgi:hypothetical protein